MRGRRQGERPAGKIIAMESVPDAGSAGSSRPQSRCGRWARERNAKTIPWPRPTLVISLDFELAWGSFDHDHGPELLEIARWTHDCGAPLLLGQLTRNGLSATWATVGILFHDRLPDVGTLTPAFTKGGHDWFSFVPAGATELEAPQWFAASFVDSLAAAVPRQEIAFHGFSHVVLGDPERSGGRAHQEIVRCAELARLRGIAAPSFVFPRNRVGHLEELRRVGVVSYRGRDQLPLPIRGDLLRRVWGVGADLLGLAPELVRPSVDSGLVNVPGSLMVRHLRGWWRHIPDAARARRLRVALGLLRARGGILHVWLHPEALYFERPRLSGLLESFFAEAGELVASGGITVMTMGEVGRRALREYPERAC